MNFESSIDVVATVNPWPDDWDDVAVRLLATGLNELADRCADGAAVRLPYPVSLQRALDRITVMCLVRGATPPQSVIDLIRWSAEPVGNWPFQPNADGLDPSTCFIIDGYPSRDCVEWVVSSYDVEGEYRQNKLIYEVMDICRSANRPDVYVTFRKLLVERPALSEQELATELGRPELVLVAAQLRRAYQPPPPEAVLDRTVLVCGGCGNLLLPRRGRVRACVESDCREPAGTAQTYSAEAGMLWLSREFRMFTCAPGRAELRIWKELCSKGLDVELWPNIDAADLGVRFSGGEVWYADVKTFTNPVNLARKLRISPFRPPYGSAKAFLVVGREQIERRGSYLDELRNRLPSLKGPAIDGDHVVAIDETDFIKRVLGHASEAGRYA